MNFMNSIRLGILLAWKAKIWVLVFWLVVALVAVVFTVAQFSGRQPATVSLDVGLSFIRIYMAIVVSLLAQELLAKEFERRYFYYSLSYPVSRAVVLTARTASIYLIGFAVLILSALVLYSIVTLIGAGYSQSRPVSLSAPFLMVVMFLALDLAVITAFAGLLSILSKTPGFVLIGTVGFAIIARSYSSVIQLLGGERILVDNPESYKSLLSLLDFLLPNLGMLDIREIALYNDYSFLPNHLSVVILNPLLYSTFLMLLSIWMFNKRRLG